MQIENKAVHFKGLNGIRAIAAIGVVIGHISITINALIPKFQQHWHYFENGDYYVTMFFTLSGFLISYLLIAEKSKAPININKFYIRRILRIWPLYYGYFLISLALLSFLHIYSLHFNYLYYIFFAGNIAYAMQITPIPLINQFWSIGVEEQYYLFWPWLIQKSKTIFKGMILFLIAFIILKIILRYLFFKYGSAVSIPYFLIYNTRFGCMAIGSIGAYLFFTKQTLFLKITTSLSIQAAAWLCVGLICVNKFTIGGFLSHEVAGCVTLCIIISQISAKNRIINLDNKICDFLGKISYGIYVIHPLVMFFVFKALLLYKVSNVWIFIAMYPILTALTVLIAYISYEYYEKIFLKAKKKYAVVASTV